MKNTVELLLEDLARWEKKTSDRNLIEYGLASSFLLLVLGRDWFERKIALRSDDPDEWMLNGTDEWLRRTASKASPVSPRWRLERKHGLWMKPARTSDAWRTRRMVYTHRVIRLADALFTLIRSNTKGGDVLRERFSKGPTKSCFMETEVASLLAYRGVGIEIKRESGIRGDDFDLLATRDGNMHFVPHPFGRNVHVQDRRPMRWDLIPFRVEGILDRLNGQRSILFRSDFHANRKTHRSASYRPIIAVGSREAESLKN